MPIQKIIPERVRYKRKCRQCKWEDDVKRKWEEASLDYKKDETYECPKCGEPALSIDIILDGYLYQVWTRRGSAILPPGMIKLQEEDTDE